MKQADTPMPALPPVKHPDQHEFERWMARDYLDYMPEWDAQRACYKRFEVHVAYKAWQAARAHAEQETAALRAALRELLCALDERETAFNEHMGGRSIMEANVRVEKAIDAARAAMVENTAVQQSGAVE